MQRNYLYKMTVIMEKVFIIAAAGVIEVTRILILIIINPLCIRNKYCIFYTVYCIFCIYCIYCIYIVYYLYCIFCIKNKKYYLKFTRENVGNLIQQILTHQTCDIG